MCTICCQVVQSLLCVAETPEVGAPQTPSSSPMTPRLQDGAAAARWKLSSWAWIGARCGEFEPGVLITTIATEMRITTPASVPAVRPGVTRRAPVTGRACFGSAIPALPPLGTPQCGR
jgi:hypothetical protein